jgi:hypothetical protein
MKTKALFFLLFVFVAHSAMAQFKVPKQKNALKVNDRILLVRISYVSDEKFKKWYKDDQERIKRHKARIDGYNNMVKEMMPKYWKSNKDIRFMTQEEINPLMKKDEDKYAVFYQRTATRTVHGNHDTEYDVVEYALCLGDDDDAVFAVAYPDDRSSAVDMRFVIHQFNKYIEAGCKDLSDKDTSLYDVDKNVEVLKNKTLLLPEYELKIEKSEIKDAYPYRYKVIETPAEIETAVENSDPSIIYPSFIWSERKNFYMFILVDAATHDIVSITGTGGVFVSVTGGNPTSSNPEFAKDNPARPIFSMHNGIGIGSGQLKMFAKPGAMKFNF